MDQEKIGKFIAELRKTKKMTQLDLANNLGITDRAISKWENGRGLPDLSLIKPLCEQLDISINELLSGERIKNEDYKERLEENILKTIDYSEQKIRKSRRIFKIIILAILLIITSLITMFCIDIKRMKDNKPVIFSTWGYSYAPPIDLHEEEIELAINKFLVLKNEKDGKHYNNEKWFSSIKTYFIEEKKNGFYIFYNWVLQKSYYLKDGKLVLDSALSMPYKFIVYLENNKYVVESYQIPRDGTLYASDMKTIFPKNVLEKMDLVHQDGTIEKLELDIQKQANLYFHLS